MKITLSTGAHFFVEDEWVFEAMRVSGLPTAQETVQQALELLVTLKKQEQQRLEINSPHR